MAVLHATLSVIGLLLACPLINIAASADAGQTSLTGTDPGFTGFSVESDNEQSSAENFFGAHDRSRRNEDNMEISDSELTALHQVFNGVRVVRRLALRINSRPPRPSFELGQHTVCSLLYFYSHFSTLIFNSSPSNALHGNYSGNQLVAWSVMQSACQWVQAKCPTVLNSCSLSDITTMCFNFNFYNFVLKLTRNIDEHIAEIRADIPESANDWINANLNNYREAYDAVNVVLDVYECRTSANGTYVCAVD